MKIENLNFSVRVYNCLKRAEIDTVEQLEKMSDNDLMALRNFGVACLAEVRQKVAQVKKPFTNGDRIRGMTDEELRNFICRVTICEGCRFGTSGGCTLEEWLQQPAEAPNA